MGRAGRPYEIGVYLRELRLRHPGLSARKVSLAAGLSESYVGKVEKGMQPSLRAFARIVGVLKLKPQEISVLVMQESRQNHE